MYCVGCGYQSERSARFCPRCGSAVEEERWDCLCPVCHNTVLAHESYCSGCGTLARAFRRGRPPVAAAPPGKSFCTQCGKRAGNRSFCTACGAGLE